MGLKAFDYYKTVPMAYPRRSDYTKVFVYRKGKTIVNGIKRSEIDGNAIKEYRDTGCLIEETFDKDAFFVDTRAYSNLCSELEKEFKRDLFDQHGVTGHPKAERAFQLAWDYGHSSGFQEVANYFDDLADLLK
jgi:hypothetical protein